MMKTIKWTLIVFLAAIALGLSTDASAQNDEASIKQRLLERLKSVDALKISGVVGENNKGFLEQRFSDSGSVVANYGHFWNLLV